VNTHRTSRSVTNLFAGVFGYSISIGLTLFSTPLLIQFLGDERYGAFRAATNWASYIGLLELGIGGSLLALLAKAIGKENDSLVRLTLLTGIKAYLQILAVMLLVSLGLGWFISDLVQVKGVLADELKTGYWIGFTANFFLLFAPFRMLADAGQRSYLNHALLTIQLLLITCLSIVLARAGWGIPGQYLALLLGSVPYQLVMSWDGLRRYPDILTVKSDYESQQAIKQQLWQLNWPTFALNLSGQLGLFTDNIIISYILGPVIVVPFFVTQRLSVLAQSQVQGIGNATWAALADLYAKGELDKFNARLVELTRLVAVMGLTFMIAIAAYNPYFINLWVGENRFAGNGVNLLASCNGFLLGLLSLWGWCFSGTGNVAKLVQPAIIGVGINLIVSLVATRAFGMIGPLLGTFAGFVTVNSWWLPLLLRQVFGTSLKQLFLAVAKPLFVGIPYAGAVLWVAKSHTPWGWFGLAAEMGLSALIYLAIAWLVVFNQDERSLWVSRFQKK
jgi:O-antigen/teichoic acid export membrane protein